jgi:enoyl-CoA hydratase/carnithine racemase
LTLPMPLFCAVDGPALGGAVGIALSADLVWMGPEARFAFPETRVGVVPAFVSVVARRRMTPGKLMGMALTGFTADATTAVRLSMAEFVSPNRASDDAEAYARRLMRDNSGRAMRRTKAYLQNQFSSTLEAELEAARAEFTAAAGSDAAREGLDMFRKKMPLVWGRKSGA